MAKILGTPEFVAWTIVRPCELRGSYELDDPFATERRLKGIRALATAIAEQRVIDHWCFAREALFEPESQPLGFREQDVIARWGDRQKIAAICCGCPANIPNTTQLTGSTSWVGCFGWLAVRGSLADLPLRFPSRSDSATQSRIAWRSLWKSERFSGPIAGQIAERLAQVLDPQDHGLEAECGMDDPWRLVAALEQAAKCEAMPVAIRHLPAGQLLGRQWILPAHCDLCGAEATSSSPPCSSCGSRSAPNPARKRGSRGIRPFRDLREILPAETILKLREALLQKKSQSSMGS